MKNGYENLQTFKAKSRMQTKISLKFIYNEF